jgi:hypothetical protein
MPELEENRPLPGSPVADRGRVRRDPARRGDRDESAEDEPRAQFDRLLRSRDDAVLKLESA